MGGRSVSHSSTTHVGAHSLEFHSEPKNEFERRLAEQPQTMTNYRVKLLQQGYNAKLCQRNGKSVLTLKSLQEKNNG